eukprot:4414007-Prorocentrum_lima.AAC.1
MRGGEKEAIMEANLHGGDALVLTSPLYSRLMPSLDTAAMLDSWLGLMARKSRLYPMVPKAGTLRDGERLLSLIHI